MPFTFSHPAAVVPLRRRWLVFSALVVGSMAPDFEYFFGLTRPASHSFPGIITLTFPVAVLVLVIFHELVKRPLISLLPRGLQRRVIGPAGRFSWLPGRRLAMILLSLIIGMATHLFCDGFTHPDGWAVMFFPGLRQAVTVATDHHMRVYDAMQYGTTIVGALVLVVSFIRWYRRAPQSEELPPQLLPAANWCILATMAAAAVLIAWLGGNPDAYRELLRGTGVVHHTAAFVISTITAGAAELLGFSVVWRMVAARDGGRSAAEVSRDV